MEILGCPVWLVVILALLWGGCWCSIAWYMPLFCLISIILSTAMSVVLWDRYEFIVWLVPGIALFISRIVIIISREINTRISEGLATFINVFLMSTLVFLVVFGWGEYVRPGFYSELTESTVSSLFFWFLFPGTIIGGSIFLTSRFLNNQTNLPTPPPSLTPLPQPPITQPLPYQPPLPPVNPTPSPLQPPPPLFTQPLHPPGSTPVPYPIQPNVTWNNIYYHGTSVEAANEIWDNELWLSDISPAELWMSRDVDIAKFYAEDRGDGIGYILALDVDPSIKIIEFKKDTFYIPLEEEDSGGRKKYYKVEGVYVFQMFDLHHNLLKSKQFSNLRRKL